MKWTTFFETWLPITNTPSGNVQGDAKPRAQVSQSQNHVMVVDEGGICEGVFTHKVRSAKCLTCGDVAGTREDERLRLSDF